jgi:hypothetical protein
MIKTAVSIETFDESPRKRPFVETQARADSAALACVGHIARPLWMIFGVSDRCRLRKSAQLFRRRADKFAERGFEEAAAALPVLAGPGLTSGPRTFGESPGLNVLTLAVPLAFDHRLRRVLLKADVGLRQPAK